MVKTANGTVDDAAFRAEALSAPPVAALMKRISVVEDPALTAQHPEASPCRITVRLTDGRTVEHALRYPKGHDNSPMSRGEIEEKFRRLFAGYGPADQAAAVIAEVGALDGRASLAPLIAAFARRAA